MNRITRLVLTSTTLASAAALTLAGCTPAGPASPSTPASSPSAPTVAPSTPASATPSQSPSATPTSAAPTSATPSAKAWPTLQGEAGGAITLAGRTIGRDDPSSTKALLDALGTPDEQKSSDMCGQQSLRNTTYRWGDLRITVLDQEDADNDYGFSYPAGSIAGWVIDPTLDGSSGLSHEMTGPEGTTLGTPLATLQQRFTTADWDYADVDDDGTDRIFAIFTGDTTGAVFPLDDDDKVASMSAGYSCTG